jgi:precorrin-2 dehydrogenase/sirohydrochlorin ferrochelatase
VPFAYPISLEVSGRRAVVIGTVAVALGKAEGLLEAGADVTILATEPADRLEVLASQGAHVHRRSYRRGDLADAFVCVASDPDPAVRDTIHEEALARGVLINMIDDIPHSNWAAPALVRRGDLILAISTGGRSPSLARKLREELEASFGPEWEDAMDILGRLREESLRLYPNFEDRAGRWSAALDTRELIDLIRADKGEEARERILARLAAG